MKIIIIGPPGSGKGSQSYFIQKRYNIHKISTGDLIRYIIKKNTKFGIKLDKIIKNGNLINDKFIINLLKKEIIKKKYEKNFLLEGFPRTISQALELKKIGILIDYVLDFEISDKIVFERILGRRIHIPSGRIYHIKFNPPKFKNKDDITSEKLVIRKDDKEKTISKRLIEYHKNMQSIRKFYQNEMKIGNLIYFKINAEKKIDELKKEIKKLLKK